MSGVTFTTTEKRILGLPLQCELWTEADAAALRKIIDTFPWILEVADYDFDPVICKIIHFREATISDLRVETEKRITAYLESKKNPETVSP